MKEKSKNTNLKTTNKKSVEEIIAERTTPKGFINLKIENLVMASWNYKKFNDPTLQKKLVANIKKNGQIENILVRELDNKTWEVVNGNHRYLALQELKFKKVACYNLGKITEEQAKRIAFETNETRFATDKDKLAEILKTLTVEFDDFIETNPYSEKETEKLLSLLDDIELEDDETKKEKKQKSSTVMSVSGEKYQTLKLELSPKIAERFNNALNRFNYLDGNEKPLDIILQLVEKYSNEEILSQTGNLPKRKKRVGSELTH